MAEPGLPSCEDCHRWLYDAKTWKRTTRRGRDENGDVVDVPQRRPRGAPLPCRVCPKGPVPFVKEMSRKNRLALWYAALCRTDNAGVLPRDLIVLRNNALIEAIREQAVRREQSHLPLLMLGMMGRSR